MHRFKTLLLGSALAAGVSLSATAAPLVGTFNIVGQFQAENSAGANVPFGSATAIDFCNNTSGACGPSPGAGTGTGAFLVSSVGAGSNYGIAAGDVGTIKDVIFDPFTGPVNDFYVVGGLSFDLQTLNFSQFDMPNSNGSTISFLALGGTGLLQRSGFDDTFATFSFSGQTDGKNTVGTFSFSGASASSGGGPGPGPGPTPIPEPASLALFGMGLLGLGLARRRRTKATAA